MDLAALFRKVPVGVRPFLVIPAVLLIHALTGHESTDANAPVTPRPSPRKSASPVSVSVPDQATLRSLLANDGRFAEPHYVSCSKYQYPEYLSRCSDLLGRGLLRIVAVVNKAEHTVDDVRIEPSETLRAYSYDQFRESGSDIQFIVAKRAFESFDPPIGSGSSVTYDAPFSWRWQPAASLVQFTVGNHVFRGTIHMRRVDGRWTLDHIEFDSAGP